jgi:hypothetical protein
VSKRILLKGDLLDIESRERAVLDLFEDPGLLGGARERDVALAAFGEIALQRAAIREATYELDAKGDAAQLWCVEARA